MPRTTNTDDVIEQTAEPEAEPKGDATSSTVPATVRLGAVEGLVRRMSVGDVQASLPKWADRIGMLRGSASVLDLQKRMRATEGRCAPITIDDTGELLAGVEAIACALELDLAELTVISVSGGDVGAAQTFLASKVPTVEPST